MPTLQELRQKIDQIDSQIIPLLEARMDCVSQVATLKKEQALPVLDSKRETELLNKLSQQVKNPQYQETIAQTYQDIMKHSRNYQKNVRQKKAKS